MSSLRFCCVLLLGFWGAFSFAALTHQSAGLSIPDDVGTKLLQHSISSISERKYKEAVADLREFVTRYPDHVYSDYAHYWLAFAHYGLREFALAEVTSDFLIYRHPHSFKLPDALVLNAMCRAQRSSRPSSSADLRALLEKYPDSSLAPLAEKVLFRAK